MNNDLLERASELSRAGVAFAVATVVRAEKPTSAKPGANAIITGDGELTGWVGGSCTEHTVTSQARKALRDGEPRFVRMCPPEKLGAPPQEGVVEVALTCVSGGTLEVYIEPHLPRPQLFILGHLPVAYALARLGAGAGYEVSVMGQDVAPERLAGVDAHVFNSLEFSLLTATPQTYIVVASHGNYDEEALQWALMSDAPYVALVSSRKRAASIVQYLSEIGLQADRLALLKNPAGLDIGAVTPEEIAVSILAEIIEIRRRKHEPTQKQGHTMEHTHHKAGEQKPAVEPSEQAEAIDPVCGMSVEIASARHKSEYGGETLYFCAPGCKRSFDRDPESYVGNR
jgi:xanthine dehydrogenase accessory factor